MMSSGKSEKILAVAPMMDWTDRHCRFFLRLISQRAWLYTEMVTTGAILFGDKERFLRFDEAEHPVALQLGGSEPKALADAAAEGNRFGYDEININVGCPSDRVQNGRFGACLMAEPDLVADGVKAIRDRVDVPVTVKTRIGIDDRDDYGFLRDFIGKIADAGCAHVIVHARKAILSGLSPKENREIPPLDYPRVQRLKRDFSDLTVILNGGLKTPAQILDQIDHVDGVMIGREAYQNPYALLGMEQALFGMSGNAPSRHEIVRRFIPYMESQCRAGVPLKSMSRHILGLFNGLPGARAWRRHLSEHAVSADAEVDVVEAALALVPESRQRDDATCTGVSMERIVA
jgi:tRNA-dihydrouridine synthase A